MDFNDLMEDIISPGLCVMCGTCVGVCPEGILREDVGEPPFLVDKHACSACGLCYIVCPGKEVDFEEARNIIFGKDVRYDPYLGSIRRVYVGYAVDEKIRQDGASGGVATALSLFLLENNFVDGILSVKMSLENPIIAESLISSSREEILGCAQSKYQPVPANVVLGGADRFNRLAIVGKGCQIQGIRKWEITDMKFRDKIKYCIGLFCGLGNMELAGTDFLLNKLGVRREEVAFITYRGGNYPGGFKVTLKDGSIKFVGKDEYKLLHLLFADRRCLYCPDYSNELSDISIGDAFYKRDRLGWSTIIVRSEAGEHLLKEAIKNGFVHVEEITPEDLVLNQWFHFSKLRIGSLSRISLLTHTRRPNYTLNHSLEGAISLEAKALGTLLLGLHAARGLLINLFGVLPFFFFRRLSYSIRRGM